MNHWGLAVWDRSLPTKRGTHPSHRATDKQTWRSAPQPPSSTALIPRFYLATAEVASIATSCENPSLIGRQRTPRRATVSQTRVASRGAKILVRGEAPVSGGEATAGKSSEGRRGRLNYSAFVRSGGYILFVGVV